MRILRCREDDLFSGPVLSLPSPPFQFNKGTSWPLDLPWLPEESYRGRNLVCVSSGHSLLGLQIVKELLGRGYSVRLTVQSQQDTEEAGIFEGLGEMGMVEGVVVANMGDLSSLCEAFAGCDAVFHTSSFIDPNGLSGYLEKMALVEAEAAENVIKACARVGSVRGCIFSSSLLTSIWQRNGISGVLNENCWSDEEFCRENKLWLALGKTMAEKAAWSKSQELNVKLVSICHGLLTVPSLPSVNDSSAIPYLKGGSVMLQRGVLATVDIKKVAKAHVSVFEAMSYGAYGRYICFDRVVGGDGEAVELEESLGLHGLLSRGGSVPQVEEAEEQRGILSNAKLDNLMSRVRSWYHCKC